MTFKYEKLTPVSLKGHAVLNEKWGEYRIAEDAHRTVFGS